MAYIKLQRKKDERVPTTKKREYQEVYQDRRWSRLRKLKMINNPLCERCEMLGKVTPTQEIHHIKPFDKGKDEAEREELAFDYDNLESLCPACHEIRHKELYAEEHKKV